MPVRLTTSLPVLLALGALLLIASACGDDDEAGSGAGDGAPNSSPFSLGSTLTIRGQEVELPPGVTYTNQSAECQDKETAFTFDCANDLKMLIRGDSYILFDIVQPRVIARRIEPEDESDFRPLLGLISGTTSAGDASPTAAP